MFLTPASPSEIVKHIRAPKSNHAPGHAIFETDLIISIHKAGNKNHLSNYGLINLNKCLQNTGKMLQGNVIEPSCLQQCFLSNQQFGFRDVVSTADALVHDIGQLKSSLDLDLASSPD